MAAWKNEARSWLVRMLSLDEHPDHCLEWPYAVSESGYPRGNWRGKTRLLARAICAEVHGPPPTKKWQAAHLPGVCHNKRCLNPNHLRWATAKENISDKKLDGTHRQGADHQNSAPLTLGDAVFIHQAYGKLRQADLAERFDVSTGTVGRIQREEGRWSWLAS